MEKTALAAAIAAGSLVGWTGAGFEFWAAIIHKLGRHSEFSAGY